MRQVPPYDDVDPVVSEVTGPVHWAPCVVIGDDDPAIRNLVQTKLKLAGLCVHTCASGAEVMFMVASVPVDLVVLDVSMPGMSGLSVLEQMSAQPGLAAIPVILLTARSGSRHVEAGYRAGAVDYVTKPFSPNDLLGRVLRAVDRAR